MALTTEQRDVFLLAMEKTELYNTRAMDHASCSGSSCSRKSPGISTVIDWAIDYMACLPDNAELSRLVVKAHTGSDEKWDISDIRRCGGACRAFYRRVAHKRLFGAGLNFIK
jgi:hypothetical protein